jgi:SAM-dependent methyltransferase
MVLITLVILGILFCFSFVVLFGAPYLPTLGKQVDISLDLLDLKPGQTMLELGCGDGRVLIAAAERGWNAVGYELNPLLAFMAWARTRKYGRRVKVHCANFWAIKWPVTDGIFGFILPRYMSKLHKKVIQECRMPVKVVSFAFVIEDKKPTAQKCGVYLYKYR